MFGRHNHGDQILDFLLAVEWNNDCRLHISGLIDLIFDFFKLNPVAVQFDLEIESSEEEELAVFFVTCVTGAVSRGAVVREKRFSVSAFRLNSLC